MKPRPEPPAEVITGQQALVNRGPDAWPKVTVAILACNRRDPLRVTLGKISTDLDYPRAALEVIVVDNASTDGTAQMLAAEFPSVRLIPLPHNVGISGWNEGFAVASGEWCLVLDDDCWIDGPALKLTVAAAEANRADLVSFRVRSADENYYFTQEFVSGLLSFWGCAALMSRRTLQRLGGYDPYMFVWSHELEFTMRLLSAGLRHLYLPEVVAVHMKPPTGRQALRRAGIAPEAGTAENGSRGATPEMIETLLRQHQANYRHWAYAAAKLLQPLDATRVVGRLTMAILLELVARTPRTARSLPSLAAGVISGVRAREPVRPRVSAAYRDNFVTFANPLQFLRSPRERVGALRRGSSRAVRDGEQRFAEFRRLRPRYYPEEEAGLLEL